MKKVINVVLMCVVIFSMSILLGGCGKDTGISKSATPYTSVDGQGKKVYLIETNPEVVKVKEIVAGYVKAVVPRDYRTIKGDEEYSYYSQTVLKDLNGENDIANTKAAYVKYQMIKSLEGIQTESTDFTDNYSKCYISSKVKSKMINGTDALFKAEGYAKNQIVEQTLKIKLIKENNVWKVDALSWSDAKVTK